MNVTEGRIDPLANARHTGYSRTGFATAYDACRPRPPSEIINLLTQLALSPRPRLVVDLGSGTGLSTLQWGAHADKVIGIEPLDEMRKLAVANNTSSNVTFKAGVAQATELASGTADIVTCAQSLHHMEPETTFAEVARILRPGGLFAAYDYDYPPVVHWEAENAFLAFIDRIGELRLRHGIESKQQQWDKAGHLDRLRDSGHFRYVRETFLHQREPCSAERWVGFALTLRLVPPVLDLGLAEDEVGLIGLRDAACRAFGEAELPWHASYCVRLAIK